MGIELQAGPAVRHIEDSAIGYKQHSPKVITRDNVPGRALRAMLYAGSCGMRPTYGDLQEISRKRGYEFNNASAAVSQLREILSEADIATVECSKDKPGRLYFIIWDPIGFQELLRNMSLPFEPRWKIYEINVVYKCV